jgi:hypothetical protein
MFITPLSIMLRCPLDSPAILALSQPSRALSGVTNDFAVALSEFNCAAQAIFLVDQNRNETYRLQ